MSKDEDIKLRIEEFMKLFDLEINQQNIEELLDDLTSPDVKTDWTSAIKYLPDELKLKIKKDDPIASGTYGTIYRSTDDKSVFKYAIIKDSNINPKFYFQIRNIIKEGFIQFILTSDPDEKIYKHIPELYGIYSELDGNDINLIIHMDKGTMTLDKYFDLFIDNDPSHKLSFNIFSHLLLDIIHILDNLFIKYKYSHRDLKCNNIMYFDNGPDPTIKLIDFGMSAMTINYNDKEYSIKDDNMYESNLGCNPKQDLGVLFTYIYEFYYVENKLDRKGQLLLNYIFTGRKEQKIKSNMKSGSFESKINSRIIRNNPNAAFHAAYNRTGSLHRINICNNSGTKIFTIDNIKNKIYEINIMRGGTRRRLRNRRSSRTRKCRR